MNNLNNMYFQCPPLMSDGRTSVKTNYLPKNDTFFTDKGDASNSFQFRDQLQKSGMTDIKDNTKYNECTKDPYGNVVISKNIVLEYETGGSFLDAFKPLTSVSYLNTVVGANIKSTSANPNNVSGLPN